MSTADSAATARLRMLDIHKRFGATVALDGVDLSVRPGEVLSLIGENGAGKSTLMKVLSGAVRPDSGSMLLGGQPYAPTHPLDARRQGIAMIYQELSLVPHLSVMENAMLGIEPARFGVLDYARMRRATAGALQQLGHPEIDPGAPAQSLSIGQRQLVEIARALVSGCRVLVLDEPTSSLAEEDARRLFTLLRVLRDRGQSIIYISHFLEEVLEIADAYQVLRDGRSVGQGGMPGASIDQLVQLMVGRTVTQLYPRSSRTPGEVVLQLDRLTGTTKPREASLELRRGEVLGIAGLVGAGRTELLRAVFGLEPVASGRIRVKTLVGGGAPATRWRQGVGLLSEDRKTEGLAQRLSLAENLTLSRTTAARWGWLVRPRRQARAAADWISRLAIRCQHPWQVVETLSGGNQQKVALARLLHHEADVLLLDEPTRGIDVGSKAEIYRLIDQVATEGKAVLFVSSYLPELLGMSDRIAVMTRGKLGPARRVQETDEHRVMKEATGHVP